MDRVVDGDAGRDEPREGSTARKDAELESWWEARWDFERKAHRGAINLVLFSFPCLFQMGFGSLGVGGVWFVGFGLLLMIVAMVMETTSGRYDVNR
jgi:hypothetical protein